MRVVRYENVSVNDKGNWEGRRFSEPLPPITLTEVDYKTGKEIRKVDLGGEKEPQGVLFTATPSLFLIGQAWDRGCDFEDLADGFGPGAGTHGDWSGIRDSSKGAIDDMLTRALNYLFCEED